MNVRKNVVLAFAGLFLCSTLSATMAGGLNRELQADKFLGVPSGNKGALIEGLVTPKNEPAMNRTTVAVTWTDTEVIVRFDCTDDKLVTNTRARDDAAIGSDDSVELFLDMGHTHDLNSTNWLHLIVNASGSVLDEHGPARGFFKLSGDPMGGFVAEHIAGLQTRTETTPAGWSAEIRIPWAGLPGRPAKDEVWGFNVCRGDQPAKEHSSFSPTWGSFYNIDQWGHLACADSNADFPAIRQAIKTKHDLIAMRRTMKTIKNEMYDVERENLETTWVELKGEAYGAQLDACGPIGGGRGYTQIITNGDYTVSSPDDLLAALGKATPGQVVFVPGDAVLDFTVPVYVEELVIKIPSGVTLASDRGRAESKGALICSDTFKTAPLFECMGPDVRISGLRLRGPDPDARLDLHKHCYALGKKQGDPEGFDHKYYYKFPTSAGIRMKYPGLTVDNCEFAGWSDSAIYLMAGDRHQIRHNYIHHNQRNGLGYGICHGDGRAESLIERNLFNYNRHSIAGTGAPGCAYEARHNVELGQSLSHCFDMHGGADRKDGTRIAGAWLKIHHNTFRAPQLPICIRGIPEQEAVINNNWFLHHQAGSNNAPVATQGNTRTFNNAYGPIDPQVLDPAKTVFQPER